EHDDLKVEFAGWTPVFRQFGNCGQHPQFEHTAEPPPGYRFVCSGVPGMLDPPGPWARRIRRLLRHIGHGLLAIALMIRSLAGAFWGTAGFAARARWRVLVAAIRLVGTLWRNGVPLFPVFRFMRSRHWQSQVLLARRPGLVFLPSVPFTFGQNPWVIE